jgi:acyl-coenzyme A thioesterase PaaI-like protein
MGIIASLVIIINFIGFVNENDRVFWGAGIVHNGVLAASWNSSGSAAVFVPAPSKSRAHFLRGFGLSRKEKM